MAGNPASTVGLVIQVKLVEYIYGMGAAITDSILFVGTGQFIELLA